MATVFEAAGGEAGMQRLAQAWHDRAVADEVVGHAFSHGFRDDHVDRIAAYWGEALGGPPVYSFRYGDESEVVRMHSGDGEHAEMDRHAIACFDAAVADVGLDRALLAGVLHDYFVWATRTTMSAHPDSAEDVPEGMAVPKWGWNGLIP